MLYLKILDDPLVNSVELLKLFLFSKINKVIESVLVDIGHVGHLLNYS